MDHVGPVVEIIISIARDRAWIGRKESLIIGELSKGSDASAARSLGTSLLRLKAGFIHPTRTKDAETPLRPSPSVPLTRMFQPIGQIWFTCERRL